MASYKTLICVINNQLAPHRVKLSTKYLDDVRTWNTHLNKRQISQQLLIWKIEKKGIQKVYLTLSHEYLE